jgi:hypothetical protein
MHSNSSKRLRFDELRVDRTDRNHWRSGDQEVPRVGQQVYCTEGLADVIRLLGKTGDGSRLLELRLTDRVAPSFFAAASNVLVAPT